MKSYRQHHPKKLERVLLDEPDTVWPWLVAVTFVVIAMLGIALAGATVLDALGALS